MHQGPIPESPVESPKQLLSADEPGPFQVLNPLAEFPILLVCDHASCRFPKSLGDMGLDPVARRCHLAVDIGAGPLTETDEGSNAMPGGGIHLRNRFSRWFGVELALDVMGTSYADGGIRRVTTPFSAIL